MQFPQLYRLSNRVYLAATALSWIAVKNATFKKLSKVVVIMVPFMVDAPHVIRLSVK